MQTDRRAPLLKTTPIQLIEHEEVELLSFWSPHPCVLVFLGAEM